MGTIKDTRARRRGGGSIRFDKLKLTLVREKHIFDNAAEARVPQGKAGHPPSLLLVLL